MSDVEVLQINGVILMKSEFLYSPTMGTFAFLQQHKYRADKVRRIDLNIIISMHTLFTHSVKKQHPIVNTLRIKWSVNCIRVYLRKCYLYLQAVLSDVFWMCVLCVMPLLCNCQNPDYHGFSRDPVVDEWNMRVGFFFGISVALVIGGAFIHYLPDHG